MTVARLFGTLLGLLALGACASQERALDAPVGLSGVSLERSADDPEAWTYRATDADLTRFRRFMIEPTRIYRGEGSDYGSLTEAEIARIGQAFVDESRAALEPEYPVVTVPGADVARLRFTISGISQTVPFVSTATRVIPVGAAINLLSTGAGAGGTLTGSVVFGIEAFDSQSGELLAAGVRRLTPGAFDFGATMGTLDTAEAVARDAARRLREQIDQLQAP